MIIGDDDYIVKGGINLILKNLNFLSPDLLFLNAFSTKKKLNKLVSLKKGEILNREQFLLKTILQFRLISSYVIDSKYFQKIKKFDGNFSHLHVVLTSLCYGKKFVYLKDKIIAYYPNNSEFNLKVNFSDVYVSEFFNLFRSYLKESLANSFHRRIETKMLKKYYPKLILKSRLNMIKNDTNLKDNFETIFEKNNFYKKYSYFYINNNLISNIFLIFQILNPFSKSWNIKK